MITFPLVPTLILLSQLTANITSLKPPCSWLLTIYITIYEGSSTQLVSLDLSSAFDTIDHNILLNRLHTNFDISETTPTWFCSYLSYRSQFVCSGSAKSPTANCAIGVLQGSVFGPVFFSVYLQLPRLHHPSASICKISHNMTCSCISLCPNRGTMLCCIGWKIVFLRSSFCSVM